MLTINSLRKIILEVSDPIEARYKAEVDAANAAYKKVRESGDERNLFWIVRNCVRDLFLIL